MTRTAGSTSTKTTAKKTAAKKTAASKATAAKKTDRKGAVEKPGKTAKKAAKRSGAGTAAKKTAAKNAARKSGAGTAAKMTAAKQAARKSGARTAAKKTATKKAARKNGVGTAAKKTAAKNAARRSKTGTAAKKTTARSASAKKKTATNVTGRVVADRAAAAERKAAREAAEGVARAERATAALKRVVAWMREHADGRRADPPAGASAALLKRVERAVGVALPPDLVAWWRLHDGGVSIFEYEGLSCAESLQRREGMEELRLDGVLADHEIFPQSVPRIAATKWHTRWIPLAQDGCGNLYCVDMGPGRMGVVGQVIRWEMRGGAFAASSVILAELLERYAAALESGDVKYKDEMFDGPYIDLLEPGPNSRPVRRR